MTITKAQHNQCDQLIIYLLEKRSTLFRRRKQNPAPPQCIIHNISYTIENYHIGGSRKSEFILKEKKLNRKRSKNEPKVELSHKNFKIAIVIILSKKNVHYSTRKRDGHNR